MHPAKWPKPFQYFKDIRTFLITVSLVITIFITAIYVLRYLTVNELLIDTVRHEATSYAQLIALTRHWNAQYGGVYVEKKPGVESNPYLKELGVNPDVRTTDGRVLTLRNPAIMTREISELARQGNTVGFHMISLKNLNPANEPDDFERKALERFEQGEREHWQLHRNSGKSVFRYVLPLIVDETCLSCHRQQGYKLGDIRGGISVRIPAEGLVAQMKTNRHQIIIDVVVTIGILLAMLSFLAWRFVGRLDETQKRLRHIAMTDELTGLKNRRHIMEQMNKEYQRAVRTGGTLSLILLDIDNFKKVNDSFGHAFGDRVLRAVAQEMLGGLRSYDLLGRIGGEEFLIASPGSTLDDAAGLAERIRQKIKSRKIPDRTQEITVTVSAGVTSLSEQDATADAILQRADDALYLAKQQGRDRVVSV